MDKTILRMLRYAVSHIGAFILAFFFMLLLALTSTIYAFLAGPALRYVLTGDFSALFKEQSGAYRSYIEYLPASFMDLIQSIDQKSALLLFPVAILVTAIFKGVAQTGQFHLTGVIAQKILLKLRTQLFDHILTMPPAFYVKMRQGDLVTRLVQDGHMVEQALFYGVAPLIRDTLTVIALIGFCFWLDPYLSLIIFLVVPACCLPIVRFSKWLKKVSSKGQSALGEMSALSAEIIGGMRVVQAFGMEEHESRRFRNLAGRYLKEMRQSYFIRAVRTPIMEIMGAAGLAALLWWSGASLIDGSLDASHFISFFVAIVMMYDPLKQLGRVGEYMAQGAASAERIFAILDEPAAIKSPQDPADWHTFSSMVECRDLHFSYTPDKEVLSGLNFKMKKGETVAIVGRSGAGKSTLINLLPRFYEATSGALLLDGHNINTLDLKALRHNLAIVTQETILFNDTVFNNIRYGREGATKEEVLAAAKAAYADEFIKELPAGYETVIGERGVILSGGQKQRLAIARALLKDAPLLILDEATSALDTESERMVQKAIDNLLTGRTAIVIAHRLSTIRQADNIIVLDEGHVVEEGGHEELLKAGGLYAHLYELQFGEEKETALTT